MLFSALLLASNIISSTYLEVTSVPEEPTPLIQKIYTTIPEKESWVVIPKGTKTITIYVEADNAETILFWLVPTGIAKAKKQSTKAKLMRISNAIGKRK
nr:hypothetical protein [Bacillus cereus]